MTAVDPRAHASLLIVEIGNSHVSIATSVEGRVYTNERFAHDEPEKAVQSAELMWSALPDDRIKTIAAGSVVPSVLADIRRRLSDKFDQAIMVVGEELHRPLSLAVEAPTSVGIDRVCSAAAGYAVIGSACAVASFGTAITIDCVNHEGAFMGGAILPGLNLQAGALHDGTAQLPQVEIASPKGVYGTSTEEAIRNGVLYGIVGGLREITERYATELGAWPDLIATGGHAELIHRHTDIIDHVVPDLCIRGIALAYRKHFLPFEEQEV